MVTCFANSPTVSTRLCCETSGGGGGGGGTEMFRAAEIGRDQIWYAYSSFGDYTWNI